eukprot:Skav208655  [mRNA]  locus=scaffold3489:130348:135513:+ [translate_table: standard]
MGAYVGVRFGEADNPGPTRLDAVNIAITNPTTIGPKLGVYEDLFRDEGIDIATASETAATKITQRQFSLGASRSGYKICWSAPVPEYRTRIDGQESTRGKALGVAAISHLPLRCIRGTTSDAMQMTSRILHTLHDLGDLQIQIVTLYGYASGNANATAFTVDLVQQALHMVDQVQLPYLIMGDFNMDPLRSALADELSSRNVRDLDFLHRQLYNSPLPPTCKGVTSPDTALLSAEVATWVSRISVLPPGHFDSHQVVTFRLQPPGRARMVKQLVLPRTWMELPIDEHRIQDAYDSLQLDDADCLETWGLQVEQIIDVAYRSSQAAFAAGLPHASKGLPKKYRGRCVPRSTRDIPRRMLLKLGRKGDYNPNNEIMRYSTAAQVKQVRRLRTFVNKLRKHCHQWISPTVMCQLSAEWTAILRGAGFGGFVQWCMDQPELGPPPLGLPTLDYADTMLQMVTHACNQSLADDAKFRRSRIRYDLHLDKMRAGNKQAYAAMRRDYVEPLTEMVHQVHQSAILVEEHRCWRAYVADPSEFAMDAPVHFGGHTGRLVDRDEHSVVLETAQPIFLQDSEVDLDQQMVLYDAPHLFDRLTRYWRQFWVVDDPARAVPPEFENFLNNVQQLPEFQVEIRNPDLWMAAIGSLKPNTARGIDGISSQELQQLPRGHVASLCRIMADMAEFPPWFMLTMTVALPKVVGQVKVGQIRPITIFAQLYRTWSRVVSQQVLGKFSSFLPSGVTGFLRQRGPLDASMSFAFFLEQAALQGSSHSGLVLDLIKCFNTICRRTAGLAMSKLGVPSWLIQRWIRSLDNMQRLWMLNRQCSDCFVTNNGCPEGDSMSIIAILSLGYVWLQNLELADATLRATCYADNWGWTAGDPSSHGVALRITQDLTAACRMLIDWDKSWIWSTDGRTAPIVKQLFQELLPHVDLPHVTHAQDLGCVHTYRGCPRLGQFPARLSKAHGQLTRLQSMPHDCHVKFQLVMGAAYPAAFYGVEILPIGEHHMQQMRPKVVNAVLGPSQSRNSTIALACSPGLDDPLVFILCKVLRSAKRFLHSLSPVDQTSFLSIASEHSARISDCHGPAGCLAYYLSLIGWEVDGAGMVVVADGIALSLYTTSTKLWRHWMELARQPTLLSSCTQRSILHGLVIDPHETKKILRSFDPPALTQLLNEISGAFQLESQKQKWAADASSTCRFCDCEDSRFHRLHECQAFAHVRLPFQPVLDQLLHEDSLLHELPVVFLHSDHDVLQLLAHNYVEAVFSADLLQRLRMLNTQGHCLHFYTDGSLMFPSQPTSRYGAYSIVMDTCLSDDERRDAVTVYRSTRMIPASLQKIAVARLTGRQTIYRAELLAVVLICENLEDTRIHVDSQAVHDAVRKCRASASPLLLQGLAGFDLILRLWNALQSGHHEFVKVKAHVDPDSLQDWELVYQTLGNQVANDSALDTAKYMFPSQARQWRLMGQDVQTAGTLLRQVYQLHLELHKARAMQEQLDRAAAAPLEAAEPSEQRLVLQQWTVAEEWPRLPVKVDSTNVSVMGPRLTRMLLDWLKLLKWPAQHLQILDDPGISYLELAVSWMLYHKCYLPVRRKRMDDTTYLYLASHADDAAANCITMAELSWSMSYWLLQVGQLYSPWLIPDIARGNSRGLYRLGTRNHACGYLRRPELPNQIQTVDLLGTLAAQHGATLTKHTLAIAVEADTTILKRDLVDSLPCKQERVKREIQRVKRLSQMS